MISVNLDQPSTPEPARPKLTKAERARANRRAMIGSIIVGSIVVHALILVVFAAWKVATYFNRPEARFEMKKTVKIPAKTPEHKMNVAKHEAMAPKPVFNDKLVSTRPIDFALPELPEIDMQQMLPLDPSELISHQVNGLVGSAALGSGLGSGFSGGGGTGEGMSFFGIKAGGERIMLLFDVSASVVSKAERAGIPLERIQEETIKLIESLPISAQFSLIQFTGNYMPFTDELVPATPSNKEAARKWVEDKWITSGGLTASTEGAVSNFTGVVGVLERTIQMGPEVIFLISDASFQWRPDGGNSYPDVPYDEIKKVVDKLEKESMREVPINFIAFEPKDDDVKEWRRIIRKTGGEFREMKQN
ncbi:MAG: VWA domain-containing protein [Verrucomicrobiae bacterium]|nr:VWA domain-containing protein [Verrucomicrobiae bacterium]